MTFAVFGQTLTHGFVDYDDSAYVYENPVVAQGLSHRGLVWAFSGVHAHNWHPLTWLSHELDCQWYGLHPGGHHLTNVLLHTATVIVLFLVLRQMTGAFWRSAFVAAVFAIHPLRVESVAWVAERKDVLSGLFFVLTIWAYARYARGPFSWSRYGLVMLLFSLGLMCKPMLVTVPFVLLLLDYWPLQRVESPAKLVMEKLPLLALSTAAGLATLWAQTEAIQSAEYFSLPLRFANALVAGAVYLRQMVWPQGLAVFYPYPRHGLPAWEVVLAAALLAGFSSVAVWQRRKQPWLLSGWLWYLVMLLPVAGLVQAGNQAHADRYTYLPQIGIYVGLTWLAARWPLRRAAFGCLMTAALAILMVCAWKQAGSWKNSETLWSRALAGTADNDMAHYGMGNVFLHQEKWGEAVAEFQAALKIRPDYAEAYNNLGFALFKDGKAAEAIPRYREALRLQPAYADAWYNLGNALAQKGRLEEAVSAYQNALQFQPDNSPVHGNLGVALFQNGKTNEAIAQFQMAVQLDPDNAEARFNLGNSFRLTGKVDQAIGCYQKALQIQPNYASASFNLGIALEEKGRLPEAIAQFQSALQLQPDNANILDTLAWLLATSSQPSLRNGEKALQLAQQANGLADGRNPIILRTLAAALAEVGRFEDARRSVEKAIELAGAAGRQDMVKELNRELKRYEAGLRWQ